MKFTACVIPPIRSAYVLLRRSTRDQVTSYPPLLLQYTSTLLPILVRIQQNVMCGTLSYLPTYSVLYSSRSNLYSFQIKAIGHLKQSVNESYQFSVIQQNYGLTFMYLLDWKPSIIQSCTPKKKRMRVEIPASF